MNNKKTVIARIVAILLVLIMVVGMMSAAFSVRASSSGEATVLPKQEIYFQNKRMTVDNSYIVPKGGVLLVEKGVTLTIEGSLQVLGTLKNEGTIIVTEVTRNDDENDPLGTVGSLSNHGIIENKGKITTTNGSIYNYPRAIFENQGTLELNNTRKTASLFMNMVRPRGEYIDIATLLNTGEIIINNIDGIGLYNHNGGIVTNTYGTITLSETGTTKGTIDGNAPQRTLEK